MNARRFRRLDRRPKHSQRGDGQSGCGQEGRSRRNPPSGKGGPDAHRVHSKGGEENSIIRAGQAKKRRQPAGTEAPNGGDRESPRE